MEHFVIINDWSHVLDCDITILEVTHSLKEAKEFFNKVIVDERKYAQKMGYEIYDDCEMFFDAGNGEDYEIEHTKVYIKRVTTL